MLVDFGSAMRYLDNRANPGIGVSWIQPGFGAAGWKDGTYGVGYDAGDLIATEVATGTSSIIYARRVYDRRSGRR